MKKVAFFTDSYKPNKDGVVYFIGMMVNNMHKVSKDFKVSLIVAPRSKKNDNTIYYDNGWLKVIYIDGLELPFYKDYKLAFLTPKKAEEILNGYDILHNNGLGFTALSSVIAAKKLGLKSIITFHTNVLLATHYLGILSPIIRFLLKIYIRFLLNQHDVIIAPSIAVKKFLEHLGVKKEIFVIPTGIEIDKIKKQQIKYKKLKDKLILLFVGRIVKEKNLDFLLQVIRENRKIKNKNLELWVIGDGPYLNELKSKYKGNYVKFFGWIEREKLMFYYKKAHALVFPSIFDTQGLVVFEAIANKLPIIALKGTAAEEYALKYGSVFSNAKDFPKAVEKAVKKKIKKIPTFLSINETCKKYVNVYKQLLNR